MNWESILTSAIGLLGVLGGWEGIKYLIHRKSHKRIQNSEADRKETEADTEEFHLYKERIEELRHANAELNAQNLEILKAGARKDEIIEDKTAKIRQLQDELLEATRQIGRLEKTVRFYLNWHCQREYGKGREQCMRRKPKQNPPLKFEPLHNDTVADTD